MATTQSAIDNPFAVPLPSEVKAGAPAQSQQGAPQQHSDNPFDEPLSSEAAPTQPSTLSNVWSGVKKAGSDVYGTLAGIAPPTNTNAASTLPGKALGFTEDVANGINNLTGITTVTNSLKSAGSMFDAYEKARASGGSIMDALHAANEQGKKQDAITPMVKERVAEFQKNPTAETVRALGDVVAAAAAIYGAHKLTGALSDAPTEEAATEDVTEAPAKQPNLAQKIIQGKDVAQDPAQQAIRSSVGARAEEPILTGDQTIIDQPLSVLEKAKTDAYTKMDEAAGFDVKAEKLQLKNDLYKRQQLGNTDADNAARVKLTEAITDSQQRIAGAESKMQAAGIDPQAADVANSRWKAGQDIKKLIIKNTSADGTTVKVDSLLNDLKKAQFSKYGNRVQQFLGEEGGNKLMSELMDAQKSGASAVKAQKIAKLIGIGLGISGAIKGIGSAASAISGQ